MKQREIKFRCNNCGGIVEYKKGLGWCHIIATGCIKPAVSKEDWKKYLKIQKQAK